MLIVRKSIFSGVIHEREIDVTPEQLARWKAGEFIQVVMPNLSASDREFIMTGTTDDEWNQMNLDFE